MCGVLSLRPAAAEGAAPIPANVVLLADDGIVEPPPIARDDLEHFHGSPPVIRCRPPASHGPTQLLRRARSATAVRANELGRGSEDSALPPPRDGPHLGPPDAFPHLVRDRGACLGRDGRAWH